MLVVEQLGMHGCILFSLKLGRARLPELSMFTSTPRPGEFFGRWLPAEISSAGEWPSTYNILVKDLPS